MQICIRAKTIQIKVIYHLIISYYMATHAKDKQTDSIILLYMDLESVIM